MTSSESYIFLAVLAGLALVALIYLLSPMSLLDYVTARGAELRERLRELLARHEYPTDTKTHVLAAYVDLGLEYHKAIWLLKDAKLYGSAFALLRLIYDAMLRGCWINKVATPEQIEQALDDELRFPRMDRMRDDIRRAYVDSTPEGETVMQPEDADKFFKVLKDIWEVTSSYTHSGSLQLRRRFTNGEIKPNYSDADIVRVLGSATAALGLLVNMFFVSMRRFEEAVEVQTMAQHYLAEFKGRLTKGGE
jgi:hypothetical protein